MGNLFILLRSTSLSLILSPLISTFFLVFYILSVSLSIFRSHLHPLPHDFSLFFSHRFRFFLFSSLFSCFHFLSFCHFIIFYLPNLLISSSSVFVLSKFPSSYPSNFSPPSSSPHRPHYLSSSLQFPSSSVSLFFLSFDFISLNSVFPSNLHPDQSSSSFLYLYSLSLDLHLHFPSLSLSRFCFFSHHRTFSLSNFFPSLTNFSPFQHHWIPPSNSSLPVIILFLFLSLSLFC